MSAQAWPAGVTSDIDSGKVAACRLFGGAKQAVIRFGVYNKTALDRLDDLTAGDYRDYGRKPPGVGVTGARTDYDVLTAHFSDVAYVLHDIVREEDRVAAR